LLAGEVGIDDIELLMPSQTSKLLFTPQRVTKIDVDLKRVVSAGGIATNF